MYCTEHKPKKWGRPGNKAVSIFCRWEIVLLSNLTSAVSLSAGQPNNLSPRAVKVVMFTSPSLWPWCELPLVCGEPRLACNELNVSKLHNTNKSPCKDAYLNATCKQMSTTVGLVPRLHPRDSLVTIEHFLDCTKSAARVHKNGRLE